MKCHLRPSHPKTGPPEHRRTFLVMLIVPGKEGNGMVKNANWRSRLLQVPRLVWSLPNYVTLGQSLPFRGPLS